MARDGRGRPKPGGPPVKKKKQINLGISPLLASIEMESIFTAFCSLNIE